MKKAILVWLCLVGLVVMGCRPVSDNPDSFGSAGTLGGFGSWVEIWDWYDLDAIRDNLDGNYVLMNDLDADTVGYAELAGPAANDGKGWQPIGRHIHGIPELEFTGALDGRGYEIRHLFINRPDENGVGLFGSVGPGGLIDSIAVMNASVAGDGGTGALAGANLGAVSNSHSSGGVTGGFTVGGLVGSNAGTVSTCSSTSSVTGHSFFVGGLVGRNDEGTVINSYAAGSVTGHRSVVGGLVGINLEGTVSSSYATGSVTGEDTVGGLLGYNGDEGTVSNSYAAGSVEGDYGAIGGLIGVNDGTLGNAYATGTVTGHLIVGGLVGENRGTVSNSYAIGSVSGGDPVGGLVGYVSGGIVTDSFSDEETTGQGEAIGLDEGAVTNVHALPTEEMKDIDTFLDAGWDIEFTLEADPTAGYPFLAWRLGSSPIWYMYGEPAKIEVWDWHDLDAVRHNLSGHYLLMSDLDSTTAGYDDLAGPAAHAGKGWEPIGVVHDWFDGAFDGQGYEIGNLFVHRPDQQSVGLFGSIGLGGAVQNLGVVNADVNGEGNVGALAGSNYGIVRNSNSSGSVGGGSRVGGLLGTNSYAGTVSGSYCSADVTGGSSVGGLVGLNWGTVSNSYYDCDEVLINGESVITVGALFSADYDQWLADDKSLDVDERLSQEDGYYVIDDVSDFEQLLAFGQDGSLRFRLKSDLDMGDDANFFVPYLAGEFDGNGHTISNLSFGFGFVSNVGLFGFLASGAEVSGVSLENIDITGDEYVGGLVGHNIDATVSNSYSTGMVTGSLYVGGLGGKNRGDVKNSHFTGSVTGGNYVGGLVGLSWGHVSESYSSGSVDGHYSVGGLVGALNLGTLSNSYSSASVAGTSSVGGLLGNNSGALSNSYSRGSVTGDLYVGGLVGLNWGYGTVSNSFWDLQTSGMEESDGGTGKTTAEMKDINTFLAAAWDIEFTLEPDPTDGYPFLAWQLGYSPTWYISGIPTVTTEPAIDITTDSATLNMEFTVGSYSPVEVRFSWREEGTPTWETTTWTEGDHDGTHAETLTGLGSDITYEFRSQLKYDETVIEGAVLTFTTAIEPIAPTVTTEPATDIATSTAVLHGDLNMGDETSVDVSVRYRETGAVAWQETAAQSMTESGPFEAQVTGLTSKTDHQCKAVVQWDGQENVGDILTFTTLAIQPTVFTEAATDISTDTAVLNMSFTVGDYSPVEVRFSRRESGTDPWVDTTWTSRAADGAHAETLTGLDSGTTYEFKAQLRHDTTVIDGAVLTFTTEDEILTVCVATATGTGTACLIPSHGTIEDFQAVPAVSPAPRGVNFPHGMFGFKITGLAEGATVTLTIELPEAVAVGTVWWKYQDGSWYSLPNESDDGDNIMTIRLTDGGLGDSPGSDPGTIVDPGGPGNPVPPLTVGWEGSPVNKAAVVAPWIALLAAIAGASLLVLKRRRAQI